MYNEAKYIIPCLPHSANISTMLQTEKQISVYESMYIYEYMYIHMGQFVQGGNFCCFMSF